MRLLGITIETVEAVDKRWCLMKVTCCLIFNTTLPLLCEQHHVVPLQYSWQALTGIYEALKILNKFRINTWYWCTCEWAPRLLFVSVCLDCALCVLTASALVRENPGHHHHLCWECTMTVPFTITNQQLSRRYRYRCVKKQTWFCVLLYLNNRCLFIEQSL